MLTPELHKQLRQLVTVFLAENAKVNLSAFRTADLCWTGNVLDSLAALDVLTTPSFSLLDVGTGGGFPLLPLAIALPEARLTGMDSTEKKVDAIGRIAKTMGLRNVMLVSGRAEALGHDPAFRERFDVVTARAVADINVLLEYCSPFVKNGGRIILWKSMNAEQELKDSESAQKEMKCRFTATHVYELPGDFGKRQLLIFEKINVLQSKYPRTVGTPKKNPIK